MAFRTIVLEKANRINLDLNNLVVLYENDKYWINLDEIGSIIIEDPRCNVSLRLLSSLCEKGISLVFTNSSHMPVGTLQSLNNNTRTSKKIEIQVSWQKELKIYLWTEIVKQKILSQKQSLILAERLNKIDILEKYISEIELGDITNREGLASRTYFKELFGGSFIRFNDDMINFALNYAYQIIRSKISQEIVNLGYIPSIGIYHRSEFNAFNLADDFIEPFRPIIDYYVYNKFYESEDEFFTSSFKQELVNILNYKVKYDSSLQKIHNCIPLYLQNMFSFLETGEVNKIIFPYHEEMH